MQSEIAVPEPAPPSGKCGKCGQSKPRTRNKGTDRRRIAHRLSTPVRAPNLRAIEPPENRKTRWRQGCVSLLLVKAVLRSRESSGLPGVPGVSEFRHMLDAVGQAGAQAVHELNGGSSGSITDLAFKDQLCVAFDGCPCPDIDYFQRCNLQAGNVLPL